ncbi:uncharacterized protein [Nicotiana tomentosiformis]|uniref:uncharacterized protein n=1 Tax=Nicotiana tomentosiformis TaxID=4098 RepID=UPI00388CD49D
MAEYEACILGLKLAIDTNVQELLVFGYSDLLVHQVLGEWARKNTKILSYLYYVQELMERFTKIEFKHVPRMQNEFADALATLSSMIQHPDKNFIDPIPVGIHNQPAYCAHAEEEVDGNPWFHDIKEYLEKGEYPEFILVAIDYFTKWVEATSYKAVTKKVVADFVRDRIVCRFGVPESIITYNAANLNSDLMKSMCETFKTKHKYSVAYMPQMNRAVEAANKNIKKILRKMVDNHK